MPEIALAQRLLTLFTTRECAEAIAGDFAESRGARGSLWFWRQTLATALALCGRTLSAAPLRSVRVVAAGGVLFGALAFTGFAPTAILMFPGGLHSSVQWIWLSLAWWSAAFFTGFTLVHLSPVRGMAASVVLALMGEAVLLALRLTILEGDVLRSPVAVFLAIAMFTAVPLLAGSTAARRRIVGVVCVLMAMVATPAWSQTGEWRDESPHTVTKVEVEDGVRLEVLDWGGSGRALVLLAGLGDAAHVFDDMAPTLAMRYRVVAVSRRGHPGSSSPATGYTVPRLAEDVARVMDAVGLKTAVVVGHSFAGEEMHVLGARYASRIAGLVYVDAAFDRADRFAAFETASRALPAPPRPQPAELASFAALRAYLTRTQGAPGPEARLRARYVGNADGTVRGPWSPEPHVMQAYSGEMRALTQAYTPERIRVPALAIYASPASADELMRPWYPAGDAALRQRVEALYPLNRENVVRHTRWFLAFADAGRAVEMPGGHDLVVTNPGEVVRHLDAFVATLRIP